MSIPNFDKHSTETKAALIDLLEDFLMNDPAVPEHQKITVRLGRAYKVFDMQLRKALAHFMDPKFDMEESEALLPERQEFLEYLQMMKAGLDSFLALHPITPPDGSVGQESERP